MALWQWGSQCYLDGWKGNLDANEFYGSREQWDKYAGIKQEEKPTEPEKPTPTEPEITDGFIRKIIKAILVYLMKIIGE